MKTKPKDYPINEKESFLNQDEQTESYSKILKNDSDEFPKDRYNILNGSIPLTEVEKEELRADMKRASEYCKKMFNKKVLKI